MQIRASQEAKLTILSTAIMALTYVVFDTGLLSTPLTAYGANHWIPEFFVLIAFGYWATGEINILLVKVIAVCVLIYTLLTYTLLNLASFGIGTSCLFCASFITGIWLRKNKRR